MENSDRGRRWPCSALGDVFDVVTGPASCASGRVAPLRPGERTARGQPTRAGSAQATRTARWWWHSATPLAPSSSTSGVGAPQRAQQRRAASAISSRDRATPSSPPGRPCGATSGIDQLQQPAQRGDRPRGDDVERSRSPCSSSARPRTTSTLASPSVVDDLLEEGRAAQQRLDQRHRRSGRAIASTSPGQPGARADVADRRRPRGQQLGEQRRSSAGAAPTAGAPPGGRSGRGRRPSVASRSAYRSRQRQPVRREHPPRRLGRGGCFT